MASRCSSHDVPSVRISLQPIIIAVVCAFLERCLHESSSCLHTSPPLAASSQSPSTLSRAFSACTSRPTPLPLSAHFLNVFCMFPPDVYTYPLPSQPLNRCQPLPLSASRSQPAPLSLFPEPHSLRTSCTLSAYILPLSAHIPFALSAQIPFALPQRIDAAR